MNSEGEDDPMVSGTIIPMMARMEILVSSLGAKGSSHCPIGLRVHEVFDLPQRAERLGMRLRNLGQPMAFSQLDGSITSRVQAT